jgi:hypothetical protein
MVPSMLYAHTRAIWNEFRSSVLLVMKSLKKITIRREDFHLIKYFESIFSDAKSGPGPYP